MVTLSFIMYIGQLDPVFKILKKVCLIDKQKHEFGDVYVIFDKYKDFSIKSDTRKSRVSSVRKSYIINKTTPLPQRDILLSSNRSKTQLIDVLCNYIIEELGKTMSNDLYLTWESEKK